VPGQIEHLEIRDLVRALRSLPEQQRTAVLMIGLTSDYYEAASACKVPSANPISAIARPQGIARTDGSCPIAAAYCRGLPEHGQNPRRGQIPKFAPRVPLVR
jgi:hypothetical protein